MANFEIIRIEKLKTMACVKRSALHTFREIPVENAIAELQSENTYRGENSAEGVCQAVHAEISVASNKDKQAVRCVEFFVSASPEQFEPGGKFHDRAAQDKYFGDALKWIKDKHGAEQVVCHAVHRDEKTPHLVVYAVPIVHVAEKIRKRSVGVKGGAVGERRLIDEVVPAHTELSCKAYYGKPDAFKKLQDEFHAAVGLKNGLDRGVSRAEGRKHKKTAVWYAEKEAGILARELALATGEQQLALDRKELAGKGEAVEVKAKALDGREAGLETRAKVLATGEQQLALDQKELVVRESSARVHEQEVKEMAGKALDVKARYSAQLHVLDAKLAELTPVQRQVHVQEVKTKIEAVKKGKGRGMGM